MSWQDEKQPLLDSIAENVEKITSLQGKDLARTEDLGKKFSFESAVSLFDRIIDFFGRFSAVDLSFLSAVILDQIRTTCVNVQSQFEQIRTVDLTQHGNPADTRNQLIRSLDESFSNGLSLLSSVLASFHQEDLDIEKRKQEADHLIAQIKTTKAEFDDSSQKIQSQMKKALSDVQQVAASAGVAVHAVHFDEEAKRHEESSHRWFRNTVWLASGAFALTALAFWHATATIVATDQAIQIAIAKITVLAVVYSCMIWSAKIYRSERHNWIVNRHRCNALRTFETFVSSAGDEHTKNAVLLQATESIFGHQPSGFSDRSHDSGSPKILEVFRGLTSRTPPSE